MQLTARKTYRFGTFEVNAASRSLHRDGVRISLGSKAFDVLLCLVENPGQPVSKEHLLKTVWPSSFVEESNVPQHVAALRKALGDCAGCIVTLPGQGYQFTAEVQAVDAGGSDTHALPRAAEAGAVLVRTLTRVVSGEQSIVETGVASPPAVARTGHWVLAGCLGAVGLGAACWAAWAWTHRTVAGDHHEVVLATFENTTGEAQFDGTLDAALAIDLEESPYLAIAGAGKVHDTLKLMERSPGDPVVGAVAREVCQRMNDQAVLNAKIARFGQKYLVTLTATDCGSGNELVRTRSVADRAEGVLASVDVAAEEMRKRLGEPLKSLRQFDTPLHDKMTASLDALKVYSHAKALQSGGKYPEAIPLFQRAIELDPNFAAAYADLAYSYGRMGEFTLNIDNYAKAYAVRNHASERDRIFIETQYAMKQEDGYGIMRSNAAWAAMYPNDIRPWLTLGQGNLALGREELAIEPARKAIALEPKNGAAYEILTQALAQTGRIEEAKAAARQAVLLHIDGPNLHTLMADIAYYERDWAEIDRQMAWAKGTRYEPAMLYEMAKIDNAEGKGRAEEALWRQAVDEYRQQGMAEFADRTLASLPRDLAELGMTGEARILLKQIPPADYATDYIVALAETGDTARAQADADDMARNNPQDTIDIYIRVPEMRAAVALYLDKPEDAIGYLQPTLPYDFRGFDPVAQRGEAYLKAKQPIAAAEQFRKMIDHAYVDRVGANVALAHLGLARALEMQGDHAGARREYESFLTLWKDADPDLPPVVAAKAELASLPR